MATRFKNSIATVALSSLMAIPVAAMFLALTVSVAVAKSEKSNGGNTGKSTDPAGGAASSKNNNGTQNKIKNKKVHDRFAGELKNLNAEHSTTNGQGYLNTNTNNNVGQIATLKEVVSLTTSARNDLENAQTELATHLDQNPDLKKEEVDELIASADPLSESFDPDFEPSELQAKTLELIKKTNTAQTSYDDMTASFEDALLAASGGRVLSDGALLYFKAKLGF